MRTRDAALIRKLCGLGLPPQSLVQSLLPALREIIPAHSGGVFWVDAEGQMTALYAERLLEPEAMASYYERHYKNAADGFVTTFRRRARSEEDPVSSHSFTRAQQGSAYFREVLSVLDAFHVLYAILWHDGTPFAQLSLYRGAFDKPFDKHDTDAARGVLRYLSQGLFEPGIPGARTEESVAVEESLGVVNASGQVIGASKEWHRLVRLASLAQVAPSQATEEQAATTKFLAGIVEAALHDREPPRSLETVRQTGWGRFVFRIFRLDDEGGEVRAGLLIRREAPRVLSLVVGAGHSTLSPQQQAVAALLAQGKTNPEIAGVLALSLNTANYHVKQVYAKLNVSDRNAVQVELLRRAGGVNRSIT